MKNSRLLSALPNFSIESEFIEKFDFGDAVCDFALAKYRVQFEY